eukprot:COSAG06_NODE_21220_length_765_cov_1.093093_2_plen_73_part_01
MRECALLTRGGADNRYVSASAAIACHCFTALASYMPPQALLLPAAKPNTHTYFLVFSCCHRSAKYSELPRAMH